MSTPIVNVKELRALLKEQFKGILKEALSDPRVEQKNTIVVRMRLLDRGSGEIHRKLTLSLNIEDDPAPKGEEE